MASAVKGGGEVFDLRRAAVALAILAIFAAAGFLVVRGRTSSGLDEPRGSSPGDPDLPAHLEVEGHRGTRTGIDASQGFAEPAAVVRASVRGRVRTERGVSPPQGLVSIPTLELEAAIGEDGEFFFEDVEPGEVRFEVTGLPEPFLEPYQQGRGQYLGETIAGWGPQQFELVPGKNEIVLRVFEAVSVHGIVVAPSGEGIEGVGVSVLNTDPTHAEPGYIGSLGSTITDDLGRFRISGLYPGLSRIRVEVRRTSPYWSVPAPVEDLELTRGIYDMVLRLGGGPHVLSGTIRDQDGQPFPEIAVLVYYNPRPGYWWIADSYTFRDRVAEAVTDANGRFSFEGMHSGPYTIQTGLNPTKTAKADGLARTPPPVHIELNDHLDRDLEVYRSRPFELTLSLVDQHGLAADPWRHGLQVFLIDGETTTEQEVARDGTVWWSCDYPHPTSVAFEIRLAGQDIETLWVFPVAGESRRESLEVPLGG